MKQAHFISMTCKHSDKCVIVQLNQTQTTRNNFITKNTKQLKGNLHFYEIKRLQQLLTIYTFRRNIQSQRNTSENNIDYYVEQSLV